MRLFIMILLLGLGFQATAADKPKKSSEIPERREFPVNPDIKPCQDFYGYVCSKVNDSYELPADRSRHFFSFDDSAERLLTAKKKYFSELANLKTENPREESLKNYYAACMNEKARSKEEKAVVDETVKKVNAIKSREEFLNLLAENRLVGQDSALGFYPISNQDDPHVNDVGLHVEWTSLPEKSFYEKAEVVKELQDVIQKFFESIGDNRAIEKAKQVISFEKDLAKDMLLPSEYHDAFSKRTYVPRAQILKKYPAFQLKSLFAKISPKAKIRDMAPKETAKLNADLENMPLDELKAVYLYNKLADVMDDAYPEFYQTMFKFQNKNFGGPEVRPPRNERCTTQVMNHFRPELDSILWTKIFPNFPREKFTALAEKIRGSIVDTLNANTWLSPSARKEAVKKISTATLQLIAPLNDEEWNFLPAAKYSADQPLQNKFLVAKVNTEKDLEDLRKPVSLKRWDMGPLTINAYYEPSANKFVLPVGILQYPFYDANAPAEVNLAAIGSVMGHELGHSIDNHGSKYDSKGRLHEWMTKKDLSQFDQRTKKLIDQFAKAGHDGKLTLGENIGDLVGVTASQRAAFGTEYNPANQKAEQAYFIQYGRAWCSVMRPKYAELQLKSNPHALGQARVNEQVKEQPAFAKAFECKEGDPMVLPVKDLVKVW